MPTTSNLSNSAIESIMGKKFHVIIEKDEDGVFVGSVPELKGCHSQGDTLDELMHNIKEAIALCIEEQGERSRFVGIEQVEVV